MATTFAAMSGSDSGTQPPPGTYAGFMFVNYDTERTAFVNVRALWEAGAHSITQGRMIVVTTTFPVPSLSITP